VTRVLVTSPFSCRTERLARVAAADNVGPLNFVPFNFFDVAMIWHLGPMFF
jgi:hypothetical protein